MPPVEAVKQRVVRLARDSRTLTALDHVMFLVQRVRTTRSNRRFRRSHPDFQVPPKALAFDAYGHTDWEEYHAGGLKQARYISERALEGAPRGTVRILEWGCGPARIIRHLPHLLAGQPAAITGVDYNHHTIAWCRRAIAGIHFETNDARPPLPFPDGSFDFIYGISVFTHLDDDGWRAWTRELARVAAPGGRILFTTHGRNFVGKLLPDERRAFLAGEPVYRAKIEVGRKAFVAFHPPAFVRGHLPPDLEVVHHAEHDGLPGLAQDVWIMARNDARPADQSSNAGPANGPSGGPT